MYHIDDYSDDRNKSWCIHCGEYITSVVTNRDHAPSKVFLLKPYPDNVPVMTICASCNNGFSKDEEYTVAFLGSVISGSTDPSLQSHPSARRILQRNDRLRERIARSRVETLDQDGKAQLNWKPEFDRIRRVIVKNARGHAFYEYGEPMLEEPRRVQMVPLHAVDVQFREHFEAIPSDGGWPEVGSRMMTRVLTGQDLDGAWVVVQNEVYRYSVTQHNGGILVQAVIMDYLGTQVYWREED